MSDSGDEESRVGSVDERGGGTVKFSEEDHEESKGSGFDKVAVSADGTRQSSLIGRLGGALEVSRADTVLASSSEHEAGLDTVDRDIAGQVRVVAREQGRVRQRGL